MNGIYRPKMEFSSVTVLSLTPTFSSEELKKHWDERNSTNPSKPILSAKVERGWFDETSRIVCPVNTTVDNDLSLYALSIRDEDTYGQRFFIEGVCTSNLQMPYGAALKASDGNFSVDRVGIKQLARIEVFVDLAAKRGAVLYYDTSEGKRFYLSLPDDLPINTSGLVIRPSHRHAFDEKDMFIPKPAGTPNPAPAPNNNGQPNNSAPNA